MVTHTPENIYITCEITVWTNVLLTAANPLLGIISIESCIWQAQLNVRVHMDAPDWAALETNL